jgi:effector-binding domain-containing protein
VWVAGQAPVDHSAASKALARAYHQVVRVMEANGLEQDGPPIAVTTGLDPEAGWSFRAGIPVSDHPEGGLRDRGAVQLGSTHGGRAVRAVHIGPYTELARTHAGIDAYLAAYGIAPDEGRWEEYVSDPTRTPEGQLVTLVYVPLS